MSFTEISKILDKKFGNSPIKKQVGAALVCEEFDKIILEAWGEKIKNQAQAMYVKNGILTVACLSPIIAQEMKMKEKNLIFKMGKRFGEGVVRELRLLT